jgi:hypothetical protein
MQRPMTPDFQMATQEFAPTPPVVPPKKASTKGMKLVLDALRMQRYHTQRFGTPEQTLARLDRAIVALVEYIAELEAVEAAALHREGQHS